MCTRVYVRMQVYTHIINKKTPTRITFHVHYARYMLLIICACSLLQLQTFLRCGMQW